MKRAKYKLIVQALAEQIRTGAIPAGARLPTHRDLAHKHGMSLGTATRVYIELFQLGLATGEIGRGTFARAPVAAKASTFHYDLEGSHVIERSEAIARRRLADAVLAGFEVGGNPSSMHIWLRLPHGCRTDNILVAARERGVLVSPAGLFSVGEGVAIPQAVRVCLGAAKGQADLKRALTVLAEVLQAAGSVERQPNR